MKALVTALAAALLPMSSAAADDSLFRYQEVAPGVHDALPTVEHFVPLLVARMWAPLRRILVSWTGRL